MLPFASAQWVWSAEAADENAYVYFRQPFAGQAGPALLRVSADAQYALRLNGGFLGAHQYADYPGEKIYDEYEVDLRAGENLLEVAGYCPGAPSLNYAPGRPGVIFEVEAGGRVLAVSGEGTACCCDGPYRSGPVEKCTFQMGYTFYYDANRAPSSFGPCRIVEGSRAFAPRPAPMCEVGARLPGKLISQGVYREGDEHLPLGARMQYAFLAYRDLTALSGRRPPRALPDEAGIPLRTGEGDGLYALVDLGEETSGWLDVELSVDAPCEVLIGWGEHLDDLRVRSYVGERNFCAAYRARPGRQLFAHVFRPAGLRYVQLFIGARRATLHYAGARPLLYPFADGGRCEVGDHLHAAILRASLRTLKHCAHLHYEDCPWREQALYTMDSRNQMLCGYYAFAEYRLPRAGLRLIAQSQRESGLLELCAPARFARYIPGFSLMFLIQLKEYLLFSGDFATARELLPCARRVAAAFLERVGEDFLIAPFAGPGAWNFYEWAEGLDGEGPREAGRKEAPLNFLAAWAFSDLAWTVSQLGEAGAEALKNAAAGLARAAHARFWDEAAGRYFTFAAGDERWHLAQLTQALAVLGGACPPEALDRALNALFADERLVKVTPSSAIFRFEALMRKPDCYARQVFEEIARDWGDMLFQGATTFWETFEGAWAFDRAGSLCHGWSAVPVYFYYAYGLGIRPTAPGFAACQVAPVLSGLTLRGRVRTRDGRLIPAPEA